MRFQINDLVNVPRRQRYNSVYVLGKWEPEIVPMYPEEEHFGIIRGHWAGAAMFSVEQLGWPGNIKDMNSSDIRRAVWTFVGPITP